MTLRQDFADDFSGPSFRTIDGETQIVGKWGRISQFEDGTFDVWFIGPDLAPLSNQKLAAIRQKCPEWMGLRILDGEAYAQGAGREFALQAARLTGVKRKRRVSPGFRGAGQEKPAVGAAGQESIAIEATQEAAAYG